MASKKQRRKHSGVKRKAKPRKKLLPPPNIQRGRIGLVSDVNEDLFPNKRKQQITPTTWIQSEEPPPKEKTLSIFDSNYIEKLIKKYGQDVEKMASDRKLNFDQRTVRQLEKLILKFEQRHVLDNK
jgi:hypothetical protein